MNNVTYAEALDQCVKKLKETFQAFADEIKKHWGAIQELIKEVNETQVVLDNKQMWKTPKTIELKSQVLNRKPLLIRARTTC